MKYRDGNLLPQRVQKGHQETAERYGIEPGEIINVPATSEESGEPIVYRYVVKPYGFEWPKYIPEEEQH